ncbi:HAD family hydrolase [Novosphingobium sp.]|uniref:HAD family hydrolase n=1 Tax=Novosphingobium sp. TaxID=1874826 RepID=UPI00352B3AC0
MANTSKSEPAALLFDLDGTLVDSAITIATALSELSATRGGGPADVGRTRRLVSRGAPTLVRETLGPLAGDTVADIAAFRAILAGIPAEPAMIFPGVVDALVGMTSAGHICAVVTNKPETLARLLLDQLDMTRFFAAVVGGDTLPTSKPDPAPLRHALHAMDVADRAAVMIGDSPVDARAARAAGLPFLLYRKGYEADGCRGETTAATFAVFEELPALLRTDIASH